MKKILWLLIFLIPLALASESAYFISVDLNNTAVTLNNITLSEANNIDFFNNLSNGEFIAEVISFENKSLYKLKFDFPLYLDTFPEESWFNESGDQVIIPKISPFNETTANIFVPYFNDGKIVNIYYQNISFTSLILLSVNISNFAICNKNNICEIEQGEDEFTCPLDCTDCIRKWLEDYQCSGLKLMQKYQYLIGTQCKQEFRFRRNCLSGCQNGACVVCKTGYLNQFRCLGKVLQQNYSTSSGGRCITSMRNVKTFTSITLCQQALQNPLEYGKLTITGAAVSSETADISLVGRIINLFRNLF